MTFALPFSNKCGASSILAFGSILLLGLVLSGLAHVEALEGDACKVKDNLPGICRASSECEPRIEKYIKTKRLTVSEVPSCGLGFFEEIVCCPIAECCEDDKGPSQVSTGTLPRRTTTPNTTKPSTTTSTTPTAILTPPSGSTAASLRALKSDLQSPFFDFQQLLGDQKLQLQLEQPQRQPKPVKLSEQMNNANLAQPLISNPLVPLAPSPSSSRSPPPSPLPPPSPSSTKELLPLVYQEGGWLDRAGGRAAQFQEVGTFGQAPISSREPKIINKPMSMWRHRLPSRTPLQAPGTLSVDRPQQSRNLIHLVNDRLRQQGMAIVPAMQVTQLSLPAAEIRRTSTAPPTVATTDNSDTTDPWAPFRFREPPVDDFKTNELGDGDGTSSTLSLRFVIA